MPRKLIEGKEGGMKEVEFIDNQMEMIQLRILFHKVINTKQKTEVEMLVNLRKSNFPGEGR